MGGDIDQVMTKFDENKLKLRRAFSLEKIREEADSWNLSSDDERNDKGSDYDENERETNP